MFEKKETKEEKEEKKEKEEERKKELEENNPDFYRLFKIELLDKCEDFEIILYKVTPKGKKRVKEFLKRYINEVPKEEDMGYEFGGGLFWAIGYDEDGKEHFTYIRISDHFTKLKEQREKANLIPVQQDPFQGIKNAMELIKPMIDLVKTNNKNNGNDVNKVLDTIIEGYSKGMVKLQTAFVNKELQHMEELNKNSRIPPPEKMNWVKDVLNFAKPFVDSFLNSKGQLHDFMKNKLLNNPDFQNIKDDDLLFKYLYTLMVKDDEIGREKADQLFEKAGFEVPEDPGDTELTENDEEKEIYTKKS